MKTTTSLLAVTTRHAEHLQHICIELYAYYFRDYWSADGLAQYLEEQFGDDQIMRDLTGDRIGYYFIRFKSTTVGFVKIDYRAVLEEYKNKRVAEIEKMYLRSEYKGRGVGTATMNLVVHEARSRLIDHLILGVLDTNHTGISFYKKSGFRFYKKVRLRYPLFNKDKNGLDIMIRDLWQDRQS